MNTQIAEQVSAMAAAYEAGAKLAQERLTVGRVFEGSFHIAAALYDWQSLEWKSAVSGAQSVYKDVEIFIGRDNIITEILSAHAA